jgi:hypothetical protein
MGIVRFWMGVGDKKLTAAIPRRSGLERENCWKEFDSDGIVCLFFGCGIASSGAKKAARLAASSASSPDAIEAVS